MVHRTLRTRGVGGRLINGMYTVLRGSTYPRSFSEARRTRGPFDGRRRRAEGPYIKRDNDGR
jgi:hypothetical protein